METADVVIAGAGPVGLMLARELRLAGAEVVVLEARTERTDESRAGGMHARTLEVLDQRGIAEPFLAAGRAMQVGHFAGIPLDFSGFATRYPYMLFLPQIHVERILEPLTTDLGARIEWDSAVTGFTQDGHGVTVEAGGRKITASYLVGCDGGRSAVRKLARIAFPGTEVTTNSLLADVVLADPPPESIFQRRTELGSYSAFSFGDGFHRVIVTMPDATDHRGQAPGLEDLRREFKAMAGTDFGMHSPKWLSRFGDAARQAEQYRDGRVLLAGDAAHVHFPAGGQGLNLGVQDAVNLGWKLGAVIAGRAPRSLLESYHAERHPVGARVLHNTRAQTALTWPGSHTDALREVIGELVALGEANRHLGHMITALDVRYATACAHPLAGRRVPDADIEGPQGQRRVFELLHRARPVLLDLAGEVGVAEGRVEVVAAKSINPEWTDPVLGAVKVPAAVLIRPDGHIAWAADEPGETGGLDEALAEIGV